jgi:diacylglycerol kinase
MKKRIQSFGHAGRGIRQVLGSEINMKIHVGITVLVLMAGFILHISITEWLICISCMALVLGMEMMNTAIENVVDLVSPHHHALAAKAKDAAAGAVLICAIASVLVGLVIFIPKIWELLA